MTTTISHEEHEAHCTAHPWRDMQRKVLDDYAENAGFKAEIKARRDALQERGLKVLIRAMDDDCGADRWLVICTDRRADDAEIGLTDADFIAKCKRENL